MINHTSGTLRTKRANFPLRAGFTSRSGCANCANRGAALGSGISDCALGSCGTGASGRSSRTNQRRALSARLSGSTLRACGTG